ncbi:MAG: hypothetical protein Q8O67_22555 [Deltaproteobacteria bacterium]|nr:hypothetical protein [Deltaproteobacteria bacterium]
MSWRNESDEVHIYFDQGAGRGSHFDVMKHYFGQGTSVRPDVRVVRRRSGGISMTLYVDAKNSVDPGYLAESHLKMLGYIADRPGVFAAGGARVVIACPGPVAGAPRVDDPVAFVDVAGCGLQGTLEHVLRTWLAQ